MTLRPLSAFLNLWFVVIVFGFLAGCTMNTQISKFKNSSESLTGPIAPSSLTLISPANSPSNATSITVRVHGVTTGDQILLYSDANCSTVVASTTTTSNIVDFVLGPLAEGTYNYYAMATNSSGSSICTTVSLTYVLDTTGPSSPGSFDDQSASSSTSSSPSLTWTASTDTGGSGISHYEIAIGTSSGGAQILGWTNVGNVLNYSASSLALTAGNTYYASVRAYDSAGNSSNVVNGDGWTITEPWSHQAFLKAANNNDNFTFSGWRNAIAIDGDTIVVGAKAEQSNQTTITNGTTASSNTSAGSAGAAYVYKRTGTNWAQEAYLKAPNAEANDSFGCSVAIDGDTVVVGACDEDSNQTTITNGATASANNSLANSGAVYVFKRTGATWAQEAYIKAPNAGGNDNFGEVVAISGDTIAVSATQEDSNQTTITNGATASADNSRSGSGAVYVFKRSGVTWAQEAYIKAPNADVVDWFGHALDIDGDSIAVGTHMESSNQTTITNGTSASGDNSSYASGAVYVFKRTGVSWSQEAYIKAVNADSSDYFGFSVGISGDTVVVGAADANNWWGESSNQNTITNGTTASSDNSIDGAGAVYVYKRTGTNWAQEAYIKPPKNPFDYDLFGSSVNIDGDAIVVGAFGESSSQTTISNGVTPAIDNSAAQTGAAYIFKRTGVNWYYESFLKAPNAESNDYFGMCVSISNGTAIISATSEDSNQTTITNGTSVSSDNSFTDAGAVYVFKSN